MREQQRHLKEPPAPPHEQRSHAPEVQVPGLEQQQREKERGLVSGDESEQSALAVRLRITPSKHISLNIRVAIEVVRVPVVPIVLVHPPAEAESDAEIRHHDADRVVPPPAGKELLVPRVVTEEAELREYDREISSDRQLPPRLT